MSEEHDIEHYNNPTQDICKLMIAGNIIISLREYLTCETAIPILALIKKLLEYAVIAEYSKKELYAITVESIKNIIQFKPDQLPDKHTPSIINISEYNEFFQVQTGNYILNTDIRDLKQILKNKNILNKDELKDLYKTQLPEKRYLGVMDIVILVNSKLNYEIHPHSNEFSFLIIQRLLKKSI